MKNEKLEKQLSCGGIVYVILVKMPAWLVFLWVFISNIKLEDLDI